MKILCVSTHCNIGGIPHYILTLARALAGCGVETVVATAGGELEGAFADAGIRHIRIPIGTKFEFGPKVIRSAFRLRAIIAEEKPAVIHAHTRVSQVAASLASRMTGVPVVTTCHGYFRKRLRAVVDTWGVKVVAISDAVREHLITDLGVAAGRIALIYSGIDAARFSRDLSPADLRAAKAAVGLGDAPVIGSIGRLSPVKGHIHLIEALAGVLRQRSAVRGLVIGDGSERPALEARASALGIRDAIVFIDSCVDTARYLALMDVFVFPSVKEGLGIALLEALAAGRACVASRIGGIGDIVSDGVNGILVPVGDAAAIGNAVVRLVDDERLRRAMGERGRELVKRRFSIDRMAGEMKALYAEIAKGAAR